jgi:dTMP kinase
MSAARSNRKESSLLIVLTGIDGAGKTTAARATVATARLAGEDALLLRNHAGRRNMALWSAKYGVPLTARIADGLETVIRTANVLISHARARRFAGLVVMDRHLYCQLALRGVRDRPRGRFIPWLLRILPKPDLVIHFDVAPEQALERVLLRGTDTETLEELRGLNDAYRALPEFREFTRIDAGNGQADVLAALKEAIGRAGSRSAGLVPAT